MPGGERRRPQFTAHNSLRPLKNGLEQLGWELRDQAQSPDGGGQARAHRTSQVRPIQPALPVYTTRARPKRARRASVSCVVHWHARQVARPVSSRRAARATEPPIARKCGVRRHPHPCVSEHQRTRGPPPASPPLPHRPPRIASGVLTLFFVPRWLRALALLGDSRQGQGLLLGLPQQNEQGRQ
jgi:hypothetical protein